MNKYFAKLNEANIVESVIVAQSAGWCEDALGGVWVETWADGEERKNYAGIGYTYDKERDAFIPPQPFESWVLDEDTCLWEAPLPHPAEGNHTWDEETTSWIEVTE